LSIHAARLGYGGKECGPICTSRRRIRVRSSWSKGWEAELCRSPYGRHLTRVDLSRTRANRPRFSLNRKDVFSIHAIKVLFEHLGSPDECVALCEYSATVLTIDQEPVLAEDTALAFDWLVACLASGQSGKIWRALKEQDQAFLPALWKRLGLVPEKEIVLFWYEASGICEARIASAADTRRQPWFRGLPTSTDWRLVEVGPRISTAEQQ